MDVFALADDMLNRSIELAARDGVLLQSFDLALAAAVLVSAERLTRDGHEVSFCTLDTDLLPWDRKGVSRGPLAQLYAAAGVSVYGDFVMAPPARPT